MGASVTKEQAVTTALENQDVGELRAALRDMTAEQIRALCKSYVPSDENECTIIHYATWQDNPELLAPLLDYADDLEVRDGLGWTPLMSAVNRGSKQNVRMLLERGAQIDCDWAGGMSLIADAMNSNDTELITMLMDRGARVTPTPDMLADSDDQNALYLLHYAVDDGLLDIVKLLVEKGQIPLNTLDQSGWSPLHLAAGHNYVEIINYLLSKGADVNIKDSNGNTPLAWAKEMSATEAINELQNRGGIADIEWHGDKLDMKTNEQREEEGEFEEGEYDEQGAYQEEQEQGASSGIEKSRFEIEIESSKSKKQSSSNSNSPNLDALQRQRPSTKIVF
ncbi:unnamed protein product [Adineta steineri]|uniref:Uncharacterized protein n=1 Tax=Adineta steineri TaxID=433720 RepID=A0A814A2C8_9BILA|nr:unnamed protein product [Adineta steineri]CAF0940910.1 unnamed protein product [Adineta steineri]CAF1047817.1 unnamed protein product [Adineta steineri]